MAYQPLPLASDAAEGPGAWEAGAQKQPQQPHLPPYQSLPPGWYPAEPQDLRTLREKSIWWKGFWRAILLVVQLLFLAFVALYFVGGCVQKAIEDFEKEMQNPSAEVIAEVFDPRKDRLDGSAAKLPSGPHQIDKWSLRVLAAGWIPGDTITTPAKSGSFLLLEVEWINEGNTSDTAPRLEVLVGGMALEAVRTSIPGFLGPLDRIAPGGQVKSLVAFDLGRTSGTGRLVLTPSPTFTISRTGAPRIPLH